MVKYILLFLLIPAVALGVELDTDNNGAIDVNRGGTNAQNAAGIRSAINVEDGAEANEPLVSQAVAEAGASETEYSWSPLRVAQAIAALASSASSFLGLSDTPSSYTGQAGKYIKVNSGENGLEFGAVAGTGDVTGPASATAGNFPVLDATGKILSDSGTKPADFVTGTPWTAMGYLTAETDPSFSTWLSTTPPLYSISGDESAFMGWDKDASNDFTWDYDYGDLINKPSIPSYSFGTGLSEATGHVVCTVVDTDTKRTDEEIQDVAGGMVSGNTETGISVTYQDDDGTFDFAITEGDPVFSTWLSTTPPIYNLTGAVLIDQTTPQTIGATGARLAMCWITDMTITNPINGSVTGNAGTVTNGVYTTGAGTVFLAPAGDGSGLSGVEKTANLRTAFQVTPDDTHYPSEKLVNDSLDGKEPAFDFGTGAGDINTDDIPEGSTNKYEKDSGTNTGDEPDASSTVKGVIEIADDTEALAGTDTGKAVTPAGVKIYADANDDSGMTNPMTAAGDLIYGGTAGAPTTLAKGANNTFLGLDGSGVLGWQSSLSMDDSAAQFYNASSTTKLAKILCSGITAGHARVMTWPDKDFTPAVIGSNLVPASSYYNFGTVAGSTGYGLRDNAGDMEYKNEGGDWAGIGTGGGGTSAGSQYDVQIADASSGFAAVTGEFKYQSNTLYVGTGGMSQAKTSGTPGFFTLYSNNSTDITGAGLKGPTATLASSYHLVFPSAEPEATAIWAHAAASGHDSAGSWLYPGTSANNLVQLNGDAKLPAVDGSLLTNVSSTPNDTETIYDADGGSISVTKNNTIVISAATCAVTPLTPAAGKNLMIQNAPGTTGAITIVNLAGVYYGKVDASGYNTVNYKYVSGGAATDRVVLIGIDSTHYIVSTATGTWTETAP